MEDDLLHLQATLVCRRLCNVNEPILKSISPAKPTASFEVVRGQEFRLGVLRCNDGVVVNFGGPDLCHVCLNSNTAALEHSKLKVLHALARVTERHDNEVAINLQTFACAKEPAIEQCKERETG